MNTPSASSTSTTDHTAAISKALGTFIQNKSAIFACGGSLPIHLNDGEDNAGITLRWDSANPASDIAKVQFPLDSSNESDRSGLLKLVQDCQPASFGYKGENVLDETYRKATKLDRSAFSVDFCPYERGIIRKIAQFLLPDAKNSVGSDEITAELYKLNIYAAPSGFFKAHVDTPRSSKQFGSLVVTLPCYHKGGELVVRHADQSTTFDWAGSSSDVHWAAFYSDCEHEVFEVTEGYRLTLTYNLYYTPPPEGLVNTPLTDLKSLPLFQYVQKALQEPNFMPSGGHLGIYCRHAYAHTAKDTASSMPGVLKGADMAVFSVLQALGLNVTVRAALDNSKRLENYVEWLEEYEYCNQKKVSGDKSEPYYPSYANHSFVGSLGGFCVTNAGGEGSDHREVIQEWGGDMMDVTWVNEPANRGVEMVHLTYGNDAAGIDTMYSYAALLVTVPPAGERNTSEA